MCSQKNAPFVIASAATRPDPKEEVLLGCNLMLSGRMQPPNQRHKIATRDDPDLNIHIGYSQTMLIIGDDLFNLR